MAKILNASKKITRQKLIEKIRNCYTDMQFELDGALSSPKDLKKIKCRIKNQHGKIPRTEINEANDILELCEILEKHNCISNDSFTKLKLYFKDMPQLRGIVKTHCDRMTTHRMKLECLPRRSIHAKPAPRPKLSRVSSGSSKEEMKIIFKSTITNMTPDRIEKLVAKFRSSLASQAGVEEERIVSFKITNGSLIITFGIKEGTALEEPAHSVSTKIKDGLLNGSLIMTDRSDPPVELELESIEICSFWMVNDKGTDNERESKQIQKVAEQDQDPVHATDKQDEPRRAHLKESLKLQSMALQSIPEKDQIKEAEHLPSDDKLEDMSAVEKGQIKEAGSLPSDDIKLKDMSIVPPSIQKAISSSVLSLDVSDSERFIKRLDKIVEKSQNIKMVFVGMEGSGKSCLAKQLVGEHIDIETLQSTNLADSFLRTFLLDMFSAARFTGQSVEQMTTERLTTLFNETEASQPTGVSHEKVVLIDDDSQDAASETKSALSTLEEQVSITSILEPRKPEYEHHEMTRVEKRPESQKKMTDSVVNKEADILYESKAYVTMYDLGGEEIFYNATHYLLTSDNIILLVFDVYLCLQSNERHQSLRRMIFWLRLAASHAKNEDERKRGTPPVLLVGSHLDLLQGSFEEKQAQAESIVQKLREDPEIRQIIDRHVKGVFYIDHLNESWREKEVFQDIWKAVVNVAPLQSQWHKLVPGKWMLLEHELLLKKECGMKVITIEELQEIGKCRTLQMTELRDIRLFLRYIRHSGIFLCFDIDSEAPIVVLDVQWVIDAFKSIITASKFVEEADSKNWNQYTKTGSLYRNFMQTLLKKDPKKKFIEHQKVLDVVMEKLCLLVKPLPKDNTEDVDYYIVPYMLEISKSYDINVVLTEMSVKETTCPLILRFNDFISPAIWDKFLAAFIHRFQPFHTPDKNRFSHLKRRSGIFAIDRVRNLVVNCKDNEMELVLFKTAKENTGVITDGNTIRLVVENILNQILELNQQGHLKFQYYLRLQQNDVPVAEGLPLQTSPVAAFISHTSEGEKVLIVKEDYEVWFLRKDQSWKQTAHDDEGLNRFPTTREIGRIAKHIICAHFMFFVLLGLMERKIVQVRSEFRYLSFRSQMSKVLITWLNTCPDPSLKKIVDAMDECGLDSGSMLAEIESMHKESPVEELPLLQEYLQQQLGQDEIDIFSSDFINDSFFNLFLELGLTPSDIDKSIMKHPHDIVSVCRDLLNVWTKEHSTEATMERLMMAMRECRMPVYDFALELASLTRD